MDYLPKDPAILVSSVNMLLRDEEFDTLESLCYNFGTEPKEIKNYLYGHGFVYSEKQKLKLRWWDKSIEEIESLMPILSCGDLEKVKAELRARL